MLEKLEKLEKVKSRKREKKAKREKTAKFKKLICAPNRKQLIDNNLHGKSCYQNSELFLLKKYWNKNNPFNQIKTNNPKEIWIFLRKNLNNKCYNELCWLKNTEFDDPDLKKKLIRKIFRPFSPKSWNLKPFEWLSSLDIEAVMKQYVRAKKNFVFLGPSPIDFDTTDESFSGNCVYEPLCKFNLESYIKSKPRKEKIGIILNLDPHTKGGSHWVAMYISLIEDYIFYFDSNGDKIPKKIEILKDRIVSQANQIGKNLKFYENKVEHQLKDGQCGMYCLYFIIELLQERKTPEDFKKRIPDNLMKNYRIKYYNKS
tara:strand:- start:2192 stop:3136 length:945 start_codon:yes stop_codon:yes gene_type:complete